MKLVLTEIEVKRAIVEFLADHYGQECHTTNVALKAFNGAQPAPFHSAEVEVGEMFGKEQPSTSIGRKLKTNGVPDQATG